MKNKELEKRIHAMAYFSTECINHRGNGSTPSNFSTPIIKYIEQLEQEVKELEDCLDCNEKALQCIVGNKEEIIEQLQQEDKNLSDCIENLEKQLELKNKALDNACHFIQEIHKAPDYRGMPQCEKCGYLNAPGVCWDCEGNLKKMFEGVGVLK